MLPRLEAEESLSAVNRLVLGSGRADQHEARATLREWANRASGVDRVSIQQSSHEQLQAAGVRVRRVPKKKAAPTER